MKMLNKKPPGLHKKAIGVAAGFFLLALLMPGSALAATAANTRIINTATVNYNDTGGNAQTAITDSVSVTVNLVTAHPTLSAPVDATTSSGVSLDYLYTITNNSNGPDTYALTSAAALGAGVTSQVDGFFDPLGFISITGVNLGATSVGIPAAAGATVISVPSDGLSDGSVNGIALNDDVVIGVTTYAVTAITDNAAGFSTLTLGAGLAAGVSLGDQIGGVTTFILRTTPIATINNSTYDITITADDGVTAALPKTVDSVQTTVLVISLTVTKYVANVTTVSVGAGPTPSTVNTGLGAGAITYYTSGVTGDPGDVLEYLIVITNAVGSATATDVVISDPVPLFTAQTGNIALDPGTGTWADVATTADNGDFAEVVGGSVFIYAGTGGNDTVGGGSLAASITTSGAFRVTIAP